MNFHVLVVIHTLPLWFLVFALFLPRIALLLLWLDGSLLAFHLHGLLPLIVAVLLPRILVLYLIYLDQGISFMVHHSSGGRADGVGRREPVLHATATLRGRLMASSNNRSA